MLKTVMKINGMYFAGESDETTSSGLRLVSEIRSAKVIEGFTNLKSCLDKVIQRARDKAIKFEKVEVLDVSLIDEWPKQECGYCEDANDPEVICENCWLKMQLQNI